VRRREDHLAREVRPESLLEVVDHALVDVDQVDLEQEHGLVARGQRDRLHARGGLDADRRVERARHRDLAVVDDRRGAEEVGARGVAAERGADRDVEHAIGRAGHQGRGRDGRAGARGRYDRHVVALVGGHHVAVRWRGMTAVAARTSADREHSESPHRALA
jgi:hypothetical protein